MKREQIESIMKMASANGDIKLYKKLRGKLLEIEAKEQIND